MIGDSSTTELDVVFNGAGLAPGKPAVRLAEPRELGIDVWAGLLARVE